MPLAKTALLPSFPPYPLTSDGWCRSRCRCRYAKVPAGIILTNRTLCLSSVFSSLSSSPSPPRLLLCLPPPPPPPLLVRCLRRRFHSLGLTKPSSSSSSCISSLSLSSSRNASMRRVLTLADHSDPILREHRGVTCALFRSRSRMLSNILTPDQQF